MIRFLSLVVVLSVIVEWTDGETRNEDDHISLQSMCATRGSALLRIFLQDVLLDPRGDTFACRTTARGNVLPSCGRVLERERRHIAALSILARTGSLVPKLEDVVGALRANNLLTDLEAEDMSSCGELSRTFLPNVTRALNFARAIDVSIKRHRPNQTRKRVSVVVVGAGPAGLLAAIEAYERGADVRVVEKRFTHSRRVWFDILPRKAGDFVGLDTLRKWGLFETDIRSVAVENEELGILTIPCNTLEMFLARVLSILGVRIDRGVLFEDISRSKREVVVTNISLAREVSSCTSSTLRIPADIVVGADGRRSAVRRVSGVETYATDTFGGYKVRDIRQSNLIVHFKMTNQSTCPALRRNAETGAEPGPFDPAFGTLSGIVTSAWKRWFPPFCELQVLFTNTFADETLRGPNVRDSEVEDNPVLPTLLTLSQEILQTPPENVSSLLDMLDRRDESFAFVHDVRIHRSRALVTRLDHDDNVSSSTIPPMLVVFVGDSAQTAHYRLGVGINKVFDVMPAFGRLVADDSTRPLDERINAFERDAGAVLDWLQFHQLFSMYFEAYCDCAVFQGQVYAKRHDGTHAYEHVEDGDDLLDLVHEHCERPLLPLDRDSL